MTFKRFPWRLRPQALQSRRGGANMRPRPPGPGGHGRNRMAGTEEPTR